MKKALVAVWAFVMVLALAVSAAAHGGRTDSSGGHYNRSTGEYHYHHGYSAHQHTDLDGDGILDCPYDFKDMTDHSSGYSSSSSSSSSSHKTQSVIVDVDDDEDEDQEEKTAAIQEKEVAEPKVETVIEAPGEPEKTFLQKHPVLTGFVGIVVAIVIISKTYCKVYDVVEKRREQVQTLNDSLSTLNEICETEYNREQHKSVTRADIPQIYRELATQQEALLEKNKKNEELRLRCAANLREHLDVLLEKSKKDEELRRRCAENLRAHLDALVSRTSALQNKARTGIPDINTLAPLPPRCFIGYDGCPHTDGADAYTVYQSRSGIYHAARCHHAYSGTRRNIVQITDGRPCSLCNPSPDLTWYTVRMQTAAELDKLNDVLNYKTQEHTLEQCKEF